jgi:hypothetical protein
MVGVAGGVAAVAVITVKGVSGGVRRQAVWGGR